MTALPTPQKTAKLVIVGDSAFAEVAFEYFQRQSEFEVVAFAVESAYLKRSELLGLPVVPLEAIAERFPADGHWVYVATVYTQLNRLRTRLLAHCKSLGYRPASFVSPHARVWPNVKLGEHCFIFEDNVVQPFCELGDNVVLWSGNHIGHHSRVGSNVFIASHVVVSGFVSLGNHCFVGVNATFADRVVVGDDCIIGANALVTKDVPTDHVVRGNPGAEPSRGAKRLHKVRE
jgi:sugar O-acyltransferase (sialic acid O-acetyltransferase NeuD family)